ncbi:MAG: guanylate kinase [Lachnospiraceae bacterium]|nr:guanylate kinase [Lachnospiraceae bacterium]
MDKTGQLIIISGFAGTGKGTLVKKLLELYNDSYVLSISATTRAPRPGETDGREYFFKTVDEFEAMIEAGALLEHARFVDNYYGTPADFVRAKQEEGKNVILEIEIQGALSIKERYPEAVLIFVVPPDADELERRLRGRGTETDEVIKKRLARACEESEGIESYDYIVVNDSIEDCARRTHAIIQAAAYAPVRQAGFIGRLRSELKRFS